MNEARKALINIQKASPGLPVGRFHPQLAIIADFFDTLVNIQIERDKLHRQLAEAHECFGTLLAEMATPPASKPDQAAVSAAFIRGNRLMERAEVAEKVGFTGNSFDLLIIDEFPFTLSDKAVEEIKNFDGGEFNRDGPTPTMPPVGFKMSKKSKDLTYPEFIAAGWNHNQLVAFGYVVSDHA